MLGPSGRHDDQTDLCAYLYKHAVNMYTSSLLVAMTTRKTTLFIVFVIYVHTCVRLRSP